MQIHLRLSQDKKKVIMSFNEEAIFLRLLTTYTYSCHRLTLREFEALK